MFAALIVGASVLGKSALTGARQVGAAADPLAGPETMQFAACACSCESRFNVPLVVTAVPGVEENRLALPTAATLATVPDPHPEHPATWMVASALELPK
jgi:hypothetical protein